MIDIIIIDNVCNEIINDIIIIIINVWRNIIINDIINIIIIINDNDINVCV